MYCLVNLHTCHVCVLYFPAIYMRLYCTQHATHSLMHVCNVLNCYFCARVTCARVTRARVIRARVTRARVIRARVTGARVQFALFDYLIMYII